MSKEKKIKLFGNNVMLEQREKDTGGIIHLPAGVSSNEENKSLFDIVVIGVGDAVKLVKAGDIVMAHIPPSCTCMNPATGKACAVIQEAMIQGVVK